MKIFISYIKEDLGIAQKIYKDLKSAGLKPWLDKNDILPGKNKKTEINQAIKNSSYFLALLSLNSPSKKGYVWKEQKIALEMLDEIPPEHIFIIPVRLDNCKISDEKLQNLKGIDLFPSYKKGLNEILHALDHKKKTEFDPEQKKPVIINRFHSKMCNRDRQVNDFLDLFEIKSKQCPNHPHFYFIHGDEFEGHESFIERLKEKHLKKYAETKWGKEQADVLLEEVVWPGRGNLEIRKRDLKINLKMKLTDKFPKSYEESVAVLCEQVRQKKHSLVMIKHFLDVQEWDKKQEIMLITWYIKEYWKTIEWRHDTPQFMIFFNIRYHVQGKSLWAKLFKQNCYARKGIRKQLGVVFKSVMDSCLCVIISELKPVNKKDVEEWFRSYKVYNNEWVRKKKIDSIFKENDKPVKCKCMAEIEIELEKILIQYEEDKLGWQE